MIKEELSKEKIASDLDIITKDLFANTKLTGSFVYWLPESLFNKIAKNDYRN